MQVTVTVKGIRDGLLITLGEGDWEAARAALIQHVQDQAQFLSGARLALDVGNRILKAAELGSLRGQLSEMGLVLWAVISNSPTTEATAQTLGLATRLSKPRPETQTPRRESSSHEGENAILVQRTLRSGYSLEHTGHVIVLGDVNPGAEITATGNVIVWGHLRGMVHAGAEGNELAMVCALDLSPTQLRIAGRIAVTPQRGGKLQPEIARLQNGQVIAVAWEGKRKP